jgi:hypothetical protein
LREIVAMLIGSQRSFHAARGQRCVPVESWEQIAGLIGQPSGLATLRRPAHFL